MAEALVNTVGTGLMGIIACPNAPSAQLFGFRYFLGGHPLPNEDSLRAGDAILRLLSTPSPETLVLYLISGGASAIAEKPISAGISLADVVETYKALVHSGAPIAEINAIRKHLSALKGGRLARAAAPSYQASRAGLRCARRRPRRAGLRSHNARHHHRRRLSCHRQALQAAEELPRQCAYAYSSASSWRRRPSKTIPRFDARATPRYFRTLPR